MIFTILFFIIVLCSQVSAEYPITSEINVSPDTISIAPNEPFSFNITCSPIQNIKSFELKIRFDPDYIQIDTITEGNIFDGFTTFFNDGTINNNQGTVKGIYNLIIGSGNTSTNGTLVEVSGTALNNFGFIDIELYEVGLTNESSYIPLSYEDGTIVIQDFISIYSPNPQNGSESVDITLDTLSIDIVQMSGTSFNYSMITSPDIGSSSGSYQTNGTKTCSISNLAYNTMYEWTVMVQDINSGQWMNRSFFFITESFSAQDVLDISSPTPSNKSTNIDIDRSSISITIKQSQGGLFACIMTTSPNVGSRSYFDQSNGTKSCSLSNLDYDTTYTWTISVKDLNSGGWVNKSYWFHVESEPEDDDPGGGFPSGGGGGFFPPPPEDGVNNAPYKPVKPSGPVYIEPGGSFSYSAQTYDPDGDQIRYKFDWGDGNFSEWSSFVPGNQSISIDYSWYQINNFSIRVIAQDENEKNSTWSEELLIYCSFEDDTSNGMDPVALFEPIQNTNDDHSFSFNASGSYDEDGNITSYFWDFGDGTTSTEMNSDHTYSGEGWYNVTLIVTDDQGNIYSKTMSVFVASAIDIIDQDTGDGSFPWLFVYTGIALVIGVLFIFRKQLFEMFFEIVEVDNDGNPIEEKPTHSGTFLEQVHNIEEKLNPFHTQPGEKHHNPLGFQAETQNQSDETIDEDHKKQHQKHRDIHFIRNLIDNHLSNDEEDD